MDKISMLIFVVAVLMAAVHGQEPISLTPIHFSSEVTSPVTSWTSWVSLSLEGQTSETKATLTPTSTPTPTPTHTQIQTSPITNTITVTASEHSRASPTTSSESRSSTVEASDQKTSTHESPSTSSTHSSTRSAASAKNYAGSVVVASILVCLFAISGF